MKHFYIRLVGNIPFMFLVCCLSATVNTTNHYPDTAQMSLKNEKKAVHHHARRSQKKDRFRPLSQKASNDSSGLKDVVSHKRCAPCKEKEQAAIQDEDIQLKEQVAIRDKDAQVLEPQEKFDTSPTRLSENQAKLASPDTSSYEETDTSSDDEETDTSSDDEETDISSHEEVGIASWYGNAFNGKITASGDVFDNTKAYSRSQNTSLG